ncbi:MAG: hypothetical protein ACI9JM_002804 [Halioglobus sp.]|jgi:LDH2 family malate/lactate/ureidoglycolate dehydrogenase
MNVSKTELTSLLKQAFESLSFYTGEHDNAAATVVWAEMCGMQGLQALRRSLIRLEQQRPLPLTLISEDDGHAVFDAKDGCCLNWADVVTNLAYVKALKHGTSSVTVLNCHERKLVIKAMVDCGRRGMGCSLHWYDSDDPSIVHGVTFDVAAGATGLPSYTVGRGSEDNNSADDQGKSLFIHCSTGSQSLKHLQPALSDLHQSESTVLEADAMNNIYYSAVDHGLDIEEDLWQFLQKIAQGVLVCSSEQSRRGAGT